MNYIKSTEHFINYVNKGLRDGGYAFSNKDIFEKSLINFYELCESVSHLTSRHPVDTFCWEFKDYSNKHEFFETIFKEILDEVEKIHSGKIIDELKYIQLRQYAKVFHTLDSTFSEEYTEDFTKLLYEISGKHGCYLLYDKNNTLIYVGKSVNLSSRITSSISERGATKATVSLTETEADMHILEPYLIGTLKPILNKEFSCNDKTSFKIDYKLYSEPIYIFNEAIL